MLMGVRYEGSTRLKRLCDREYATSNTVTPSTTIPRNAEVCAGDLEILK